MAKTVEVENPVINIIGNGTSIKGDIKANGDFRIDGTLIGSIQAKGKLVIGATGSVDGEIVCQNADFSGNIKGKITVFELLALKASARIAGDIITSKLAVEPGALFTGTCNMSEQGKKPDTIVTQQDEKAKQPL